MSNTKVSLVISRRELLSLARLRKAANDVVVIDWNIDTRPDGSLMIHTHDSRIIGDGRDVMSASWRVRKAK